MIEIIKSGIIVGMGEGYQTMHIRFEDVNAPRFCT
jgi:hypothetical protein